MATENIEGGAVSQPDYGLLHFRGADARKFLQGQLSNDMNALGPDQLMLAGLHNPQGRVLALLRLAALADDHIVALLPAELAESTGALLRRYVLRAKVIISAETSASAVSELVARMPAMSALLDSQARARNIAAGIPQVYVPTSGEFVAQMLNLDCIAAISFNKGCYTGQEIIARSHYRGRTKRRMQHFVSTGPVALTAGEGVHLQDGRSARIVDAIMLADGRSEFLAVAPLEIPVEGTAAGQAQLAAAAPVRRLEASPLPLPYALPE
jgi:tRNA-modifying protein YgfZ